MSSYNFNNSYDFSKLEKSQFPDIMQIYQIFQKYPNIIELLKYYWRMQSSTIT